MILPFDGTGNLPPGIHEADWPEFVGRFGGNARRLALLSGLAEALRLLRAAGCQQVFIDGSFVTTKAWPGDIDGAWQAAGVDEALLDPVFLDFTNHRAAQKARFGCEFFVAEMIEGVSGRPFLSFFQEDREGNAKGIVAIKLEQLP